MCCFLRKPSSKEDGITISVLEEVVDSDLIHPLTIFSPNFCIIIILILKSFLEHIPSVGLLEVNPITHGNPYSNEAATG